jgi:hypothetical protein
MNIHFCETCGSATEGKRFCNQKCRSEFDRAEIRAEFIKAYGGKCQCPGGCDISDPGFLSLDHIHGGGDKHRKKTGTRGWAMYRKIKEEGWPKDRYRLLCFNCNFARQIWGKCPHERIRH